MTPWRASERYMQVSLRCYARVLSTCPIGELRESLRISQRGVIYSGRRSFKPRAVSSPNDTSPPNWRRGYGGAIQFLAAITGAAEVCRAAQQKFREKPDVINQAAFQSAWVRRGLRFTGKRTKRQHPPLWQFVIKEQVPRNVSLSYPMLHWQRTSYEKSPSES